MPERSSSQVVDGAPFAVLLGALTSSEYRALGAALERLGLTLDPLADTRPTSWRSHQVVHASNAAAHQRLRDQLGGPILTLALDHANDARDKALTSVLHRPASGAWDDVARDAIAEAKALQLIRDAILESLSGLRSERRADARVRQRKSGSTPTVAMREVEHIPLRAFRNRVLQRLRGLRGKSYRLPMEPASLELMASHDAGIMPDEPAPSVSARDHIPTLDDLRERWLPALDVRVEPDGVKLDVLVPPARPAHAR